MKHSRDGLLYIDNIYLQASGSVRYVGACML